MARHRSTASPWLLRRKIRLSPLEFAFILIFIESLQWLFASNHSSEWGMLLIQKEAAAIAPHHQSEYETAHLNLRRSGDQKKPLKHPPATSAVIQEPNAAPAIRPLNCQEFLQQVHDKTYPVEVLDPNVGTNYTRMTITEHPFWISVHRHKFDRVRWGIYTDGRYYEKALEQVWSNILRNASPGARILDVGGNIGYYSLFSASMGNFKVDAFEPNLKNTLRFCESLALNGWKDEQQGNLLAGSSSSVTIWPAGVSDTPGKLQFFEDPGNPGGGRFGGTYMNRADPQELPVTTLDKFATDRNWFETRPNIAILKVDVERHEANVLVGAAKLLKARIVKNVFTELSLEDPKHREMNVAALQLLVEAGYTLAGQGGWPGPGNASPWAHDENLVKNIFAYLEKEVKEQKKSYLNLWWTM